MTGPPEPLFAELPDVPDPAGSLAVDNPDWRYPSSVAAGSGIGRLRLFTPACGGTLALVTQTGRGASVANSDREIMRELREMTQAMGLDPARLAVLEVWPQGQGFPPGAHVDQMSGRVQWRRVWPLPDPPGPGQEELAAWWERNHQIVTLEPR